MLELSFLLLAVAIFLALNDWRMGLAIVVLTGLLQDPLRKLTPGEPVYFVVFAALVFGAAWLGARLSGLRLSPNTIYGWKIHLARPFTLFVVLVAVQALHSLLRFGSPQMTGIGLLVWLAPIGAITLAHRFAVKRALPGISSWMQFYCTVTAVFLCSVLLESMGFDWEVLGEVGVGIRIYDLGTILQANAGLFRSSEIAAWHAATVSCFLFVLALGRRLSGSRFVLTLVLVGFLISIGLLTGRRKMLLEVVIFFVAYLGLIAAYLKNRRGQAMSYAIAGVVAFTAIMSFMGADTPREDVIERQASSQELYALRGQSVFSDASDRLLGLGLAPIGWAVSSVGWLGTGLGTGSQGTGGIAEEERNLGAAEGGLGKITVELGVPGLVLFVWLLIAGIRHLRMSLLLTVRSSPAHARFALGLVAFLIAKGASFSVAAQAYSDPFILLIVGIAAGFLLAMPALAQARTS